MFEDFGKHLKKIFEDLFFGDRLKKILKTFFFFGEHLHLCPWPREGLSSEGLYWPKPRVFLVSLALASSLVSSTPPLAISTPLSQVPLKI